MKKLILKYLPSSWQKKWYYFKNPGMIDEVDMAEKLLMKGDPHRVMIDVGAHVGRSLEPFAKKGWKVYAFEPDPHNLEELRELAKNYPNVKVEPIALGDKEETEMAFFSSAVSTGISSLVNFHTTHEEVAKVQVTTLKSYCRAHFIQRISFLKSDTEGFDLPVLRGYDWSQPHPRIIVCEYDNHKARSLGYDLLEQAALLTDNGYKILISEWHPLEDYGRGHKWRRFTTDPERANTEKSWGNILAVKEDDWAHLQHIASKHGNIEN
ncbi:MAG: FkbM family methyltransferase [Lewinellaceae bacterium]|nr:FkbM family methyltransferase [Saprospiraceae bacterium]MCB9337166.1 FkbM family methyltransferase [Lewinellaceae bacterium]